MVLTFTWWKGIPVPASVRPTCDRESSLMAVVWQVELVAQLHTPVAGQDFKQKLKIHLLNLNFKVNVGSVPVVSFHIWPLRQVDKLSFLTFHA